MSPDRKQLLASARAFCDAFSQKEEVLNILSHFSTTHAVSAIEYGDPVLTPFLGKTFSGLPGVQTYFETIRSTLSYNRINFSDFVVDSEGCKVALKGKGVFTWTSTGESWDETFAWMLDFDDEGKVTEYQVWSDSGSAYLARISKLREVKTHLRQQGI